MKKFASILMAGIFLYLCACGNQLSAGESAPGNEENTPSIESTRPSLPWDVPVPEDAPSYEEYFSQVIDYGYSTIGTEDMNVDITSGGNLEGYQLSYLYLLVDSPLYLQSEQGEYLWKIASIPQLKIVLFDELWIYALRDGKELFRMDYWGENRETLFFDSTGLIAELNDRFLLADNKVMYFFAGAPDGAVALYRLYVPESRNDIVYLYESEAWQQLCYPPLPAFDAAAGYAKEAYHLYGLYPISNHEVIWTTDNRAFYDLYEEVRADEDLFAKYYGDGSRESFEIICHIEMDFREFHAVQHYFNAQSNTHLEKGFSFYNAGGSGDEWWRSDI